MRKRIIIFATLLLCSFAMWAQTFTVDGIKYKVTSTTELSVEVTSGGDYSGDIVIPETVEYNDIEYSVTSIARYAFEYCSSLTSLIIPNSVMSIGDWAFDYCSNLTSINIPNGVTSIGDGTFYHCGLTFIVIPNSVTSIGIGAFSGCEGSVVVESETPLALSSFPFNPIIDDDINNLTLFVPKGCKTAYEEASYWNEFSRIIEIPEPSSTNITFADANVKALCVASWDFNKDGELSEFEAALVTSLGKVFERSYITSFEELSYFTNLIFIDRSAFWGCSGLTSITIPNSVTSIGSSAFSGCSGLTSITIPNSVTSIGDCAFGFCGGLTSVTIGNSVKSIGFYAFGDCTSLTSINIPKSVTSIGDQAFSGCSGLTSINIPNSVTSIGESAFWDCSGLTSITIPNSVTSIGNWAFYYCSGLASITVESGNTVYDSRENCNAIIETSSNTLHTGCKSTTIPNGVTSIGDLAFGGCSGLTSITIPNSVTSILGRAFRGCISLTSITIPNSVTSIGNVAFYLCSGLTSVIVEWDMPITIESGVFSYHHQNVTLYVPKGSKDAYQTASVWQDFKEIVEISKGDLNGDNEYNISDIILLIDMITVNGDDGFVATYIADVNSDGEVDIADIIAIINLMIEQANSNAPELAMAPMEEAQETSDHIAASISGNELSVDLENTNQYAGFQMMVTVPNGLQLIDASLDAARGDKHNVMLRQVAEGQYLVIGYSLSNSVLKGNTGKLLTLTTEGVQNGDIIISNVMFATADAERYDLNGISLSGSATGIEGIDGSLSSKDVIYDLNGRRLTAVPKNRPYIKNGKKFIQK